MFHTWGSNHGPVLIYFKGSSSYSFLACMESLCFLQITLPNSKGNGHVDLWQDKGDLQKHWYQGMLWLQQTKHIGTIFLPTENNHFLGKVHSSFNTNLLECVLLVIKLYDLMVVVHLSHSSDIRTFTLLFLMFLLINNCWNSANLIPWVEGGGI